MPESRLYDPQFVRALFDEMSATYGLMNMISSFGFAWRWRKQCIAEANIQPGEHVLDLMTGMGELLGNISKRASAGSVVAVDISPRMCEIARKYQQRITNCSLIVLEADALLPHDDVANESFDVVISTFGLKTFSNSQLHVLAQRIESSLKPGGRFVLLEISVPPARWLRLLYLFYLRCVIPQLGRLFLGNPDNYRMLGIYTTAFGSCASARGAFESTGLHVQERSYFFGCATGIVGRKPDKD